MGFKTISYGEYKCDNPDCNTVITVNRVNETLPPNWLIILGFTLMQSGVTSPLISVKDSHYFCCEECYNKFVMIE